ncbi:hypothetical protein L484_014937 [Morus notabilis]|uniref:Uncharacterized protein n=1 Tax=Morus notabilis TaxID=981085 RepID=W9QZF8_9ROSA|nr:hypothetical protein L484_014937 [Morus notabilis]
MRGGLDLAHWQKVGELVHAISKELVHKTINGTVEEEVDVCEENIEATGSQQQPHVFCKKLTAGVLFFSS